MKHAQDFDGEFFFRHKENAIVADAKTELVARRLELFHIARAGGEITIAMERRIVRSRGRWRGGRRELPATK